MTNIAEVLDAPADAVPDRLALAMADGTTCTYGELRDEMRRWAATLAAAGVGRGDRVALVDWGGVRSAAATLAAAHLGAATAQMNPLLTARELLQLVEVAGCGPVAVAPPGTGLDVETVLDAPLPPLPADGEPRSGRDLSAGTVEGTVKGAAAEATGDGGDVAIVLFTSGTTGVPKAVPLTHAALWERLRAYRPPFDASRPANVALMCVPSFHVGGMLGLLVALAGGDATVVQPRFDAGEWLHLVERHRVVSAFVVPTMLARILDHPDLATTDTSSLRLISYGAAAAPTDLVRRAMAQWPDAGFANTFGQTETIGAYTSLSPADHRDPTRVGSVGRPLPGVEVRVVDADTGAEVDAGTVGEIWVRSVQVVPAVGADATDDSGDWLRTGDLARQDADGYLYPLGRMNDVINRGGEKFPPSEVADRVRAHPDVADVVVVGVPDPELGQRVGVAVVARAGAAAPTRDELRAWCRSDLASFKLPDLVVAVDALPFNELGKLPRPVAVALITDHAEATP